MTIEERCELRSRALIAWILQERSKCVEIINPNDESEPEIARIIAARVSRFACKVPKNLGYIIAVAEAGPGISIVMLHDIIKAAAEKRPDKKLPLEYTITVEDFNSVFGMEFPNVDTTDNLMHWGKRWDEQKCSERRLNLVDTYKYWADHFVEIDNS